MRAVIFTAEQGILFNGRIGVFASTDYGGIWREIGGGLPYNYASVLFVAGGYLYAGTGGEAVWRRPLSDIVSGIEPVDRHVPATLVLEQNYPNPVIGSMQTGATIRFQLPAAQPVRLYVYDAMGREVEKLVDQRLNAGTYEIPFHTERLAGGVYMYRLQVGAVSASKSCIVQR